MVSKEYSRQHYLKNKEKYKKAARKWEKENPERAREASRIREQRYRLKNKVKYDARRTARVKGLRGDHCKDCGTTEDLHFHHTNYVLNKGITLCKKCHFKRHERL